MPAGDELTAPGPVTFTVRIGSLAVVETVAESFAGFGSIWSPGLTVAEAVYVPAIVGMSEKSTLAVSPGSENSAPPKSQVNSSGLGPAVQDDLDGVTVGADPG
jgi:hypothetical protein